MGKNLVRSFALTPEQIEIMQPLFDHAQMEYDAGRPGVIVCQVCQFTDMDYSMLKAKFFPHKKAMRIQFAIDPGKFIQSVKDG